MLEAMNISHCEFQNYFSNKENTTPAKMSSRTERFQTPMNYRYLENTE